ncbi:protein FAM133B-like isoform X2 [Astyanax mexicanus]|uniref:protein FAM133B-like isoform X2 n=1 Tax=Astyanax mexicanus TaxID=7994 RepID=UPI000BBD8AEC|nr:protein FAM133B-like isoform X2 [Astyanax mexicanus]
MMCRRLKASRTSASESEEQDTKNRKRKKKRKNTVKKKKRRLDKKKKETSGNQQLDREREEAEREKGRSKLFPDDPGRNGLMEGAGSSSPRGEGRLRGGAYASTNPDAKSTRRTREESS